MTKLKVKLKKLRVKNITLTKRWNISPSYRYRVGYFLGKSGQPKQRWRYFPTQKKAENFIRGLKTMSYF